MPTDVSTSLPQISVTEGATFTVESGDAAAVISQLVIHVWQDAAAPPLPAPNVNDPLFVYAALGQG